MFDSNAITDFFDTLAKILLRCWIFGFIMLYAWLGIMLVANEGVFELLTNWFGLSKHELDLTNYCGIAILKLLVIVFFFFPWLAIRLVLRGRKT